MITYVTDASTIQRLKRDRAYIEWEFVEEFHRAVSGNEKEFMEPIRELCKFGLQETIKLLNFLDSLGEKTTSADIMKKSGPLNVWYRVHPDDGKAVLDKCAEIEKQMKDDLDKVDKEMSDLKAQLADDNIDDIATIAQLQEKLNTAAHRKSVIQITADLKLRKERIGNHPRGKEGMAKDDLNKLVDMLSNPATAKKIDASDCSDIFRLIATIVEEFPRDAIENAIKKGGKDKEGAEKYRLWIWLQKSYRGVGPLGGMRGWSTFNLDAFEEFAKYCEKCKQEKENSKVFVRGRDTFQCTSPNCQHSTTIAYTEKLSKWQAMKLKCLQCKGPNPMILVDHKADYVCGDCGGPVTDRIWEIVQCKECREAVEIYHKPHEMLTEEEKSDTCPKCKKVAKFIPLSTKPFWKGPEDALRARRGWTDQEKQQMPVGTHKLKPGSVVRTIDRIFGLPERADISGTTADSIFGMELVWNLHDAGLQSFGTQKEGRTFEVGGQQKSWADMSLSEKSDWFSKQSSKYPAYLILLPLITMAKLNFHSILECAMTFTLTGYFDAYHVGYYSTLWPKGAKNGTGLGKTIWDIMKKWEDHPLNTHAVFALDKDGNENAAVIFSGDSLDAHRIAARVDYWRYLKVYKPIRDRLLKAADEGSADTVIWASDLLSLARDALK